MIFGNFRNILRDSTFRVEGIDLRILIEGQNHIFDLTFCLLADEVFERLQKRSMKMEPMEPQPKVINAEMVEMTPEIENHLILAEKTLELIGMPADATAEVSLEELEKEMGGEIVPVQKENEEETRFSLFNKIKAQVQQKFSHFKREAEEKLPQLAVALAEFHQIRLVEPTRRWFVERLTELKPELVKLGNHIVERGAADLKKTLKAIAELPTTSRQMLVAFTCVKLLREFGGTQNAYEADGYAIYLESAKKVNVVDRLGNSILRMELNRFGIPQIEQYNFSLADESTFISAAFALRDPDLVAGFYQMSREAQAEKLGLLAPHGTSKSLTQTVQSDLLSQLEQIMPQEESSLELAGGLYKISRNRDTFTILRHAKGKASEDIFVKIGGTVTNNLSPYDVSKIKEAIAPLVQQVQQQQQTQRQAAAVMTRKEKEVSASRQAER